MPLRRKTAQQVIDLLAQDPEYQARVAERDRQIEERRAVVAADEAELVEALSRIGYAVNSVWDLVNNSPHPFMPRAFVGPYDRAYPLLVKHLLEAHHPLVREGIIRALTVRDGGPMVAEALLAAFYSETSSSLKWVLANALKFAMPLRERKKHPAIAAAYNSNVQIAP